VWCKCFEKVERLIPAQENLSILAKKSLLFLSYILAIYFFKTPISHSILAIHFPYSIYLLFLKDFFVLSLLGGDRMIGFFLLHLVNSWVVFQWIDRSRELDFMFIPFYFSSYPIVSSRVRSLIEMIKYLGLMLNQTTPLTRLY
jgi:hypothetical protein